MGEINLKTLKYEQDIRPDSGRDLPRHKTGEKFLKGPIPESWLARAARLPGKAFHVAVVLWLLAGLKNKPAVKLSKKLLRSWGVRRGACYRALDALESANLILVAKQHHGRTPIVTILPEGEDT
jgi:hypothetical protein